MLSAAPDHLPCPRGATLTLQRAWPRGDDHLLCEYTTADGTPVAGQWFADRQRLREVAADTPGDTAAVEPDGVLLQRRGADRCLRALHALVDQPDATLLVHRPERRAVVRLLAGDTVVYAKIVPPGRAVELAERNANAARHAAGALHVPALRSVDDANGVLIFEALPGRSLYVLGDTATAATAWTAAGTALARLHDSDLVALPHSAVDEANLTQRWLARAAVFGRLPAIDTTDALARLLGDPPAPSGLLHRDLHDKQLIHRPGSPIGVLDTDTLAVGERALDIANLLVHLELRTRQGRISHTSAATARRRFLAAYRPDDQTFHRLDAYATATRLRLAAVYAFRPRWRKLALDLLAEHMAP